MSVGADPGLPDPANRPGDLSDPANRPRQLPGEPADPARPPAHPYAVVCVAALVVLGMALLEKQMGAWSIVPLAAGVIALLTNWGAGAAVFLLTLCVAMAAHARGVPLPNLPFLVHDTLRFMGPEGRLAGQRLEPLPDLAACAAALAYVMAQYRLQGMQRFIFPPSTRQARPFRLGPPRDTEPPERRRAELATPIEIGLLGATLPLWSGLAALALFGLTRTAANLDVIDDAWRGPFVLFWVVALGLAAGSTVLGYRRRSQASREEAWLALQDELWRQTRGDQARVNRWVNRLRLRARRRKEQA
jgi:hypothetical protein